MTVRGPEIAVLERWLRVPRRVASLPPALLVLAASAVGFQSAVRVLERFVPELLGRLGGGPITLGLFAAALLLAEAGGPFWHPGNRRRAVLLTGALAVGGVTLWTLAAGIAAFALVPAWAGVILGAAATRLWGIHGPASLFSVSRTRGRASPRLGRLLLAGAVAVLLAPLALLFANTAHALAAVGLAAGFVAALGVVAVVTVLALPDAVDCEPGGRSQPATAEIRRVLDALPPRGWIALGSVAGMRFVEGSLLAFLVVVVTEYHGIGVTIGPLALSAAGLFALLLIVEALVTVAALAVGPRLVAAAGAERTIALGAVALATFPLALVLVPSHPLALAAVFAGSGLRAVGEPARRALVADTVSDAAAAHPRADPDSAPDVGESVAAAAAAPGAVVACLLFVASPVVAFAATSVVGWVAAAAFTRVAVLEPTDGGPLVPETLSETLGRGPDG